MHPVSRYVTLCAIFALLVLGLSASSGDPVGLERTLLADAGNIGVSFGVLPNPDNTMAEQLKLEEDRLRNREQMLILREAELRDQANADLRSLAYVTAGEAVLIAYFVTLLHLDRRRPRAPMSLAGAR